MRVLVINTEQKEKIKKLIDYAEANVVSLEKIKKMMSAELPPIGDSPKHCLVIPNGYTVVYSIEEQPVGRCKHISISVDRRGAGPNPAAVDMIIGEFGFKTRFDHTNHTVVGNTAGTVWLEGDAVNVLEAVVMP